MAVGADDWRFLVQAPLIIFAGRLEVRRVEKAFIEFERRQIQPFRLKGPQHVKVVVEIDFRDPVGAHDDVARARIIGVLDVRAHHDDWPGAVVRHNQRINAIELHRRCLKSCVTVQD